MVSCGGDPAKKAYTNLIDKGYAVEAESYLKEVASAATMYEDTFGGQQPTLDDLKQKGYLLPSSSLERDWTIEISGDIFTATSTDEMSNGAGKTTIYNRKSGNFSDYGFDYDGK